MKTKPPLPAPAPLLTEEDIRAYAVHLYVQSGRIPNRDIENWLEAKAALEAARPAPPLPRVPATARGRRPAGFTMPPSDASLWVDHPEGG